MLTRGELRTIVHDAWIEGRTTWAERDFDDSEASEAVADADLTLTVDEVIAYVQGMPEPTRQIVLNRCLRAMPTGELVAFLRGLGEVQR